MPTVIYTGRAERPSMGPVLEALDAAPETRGSGDNACARAPERCALAKVAKAIWKEMSGVHWDIPGPLPPRAEADYRPVPPERTFVVGVRYEFQGRGKPLSYPLGAE